MPTPLRLTNKVASLAAALKGRGALDRLRPLCWGLWRASRVGGPGISGQRRRPMCVRFWRGGSKAMRWRRSMAPYWRR